jgi:hypothetical protein
MAASLIVAAAITAGYGLPAAAVWGIPALLRRRRERRLAGEAELAAIDAWLERVRRTI